MPDLEMPRYSLAETARACGLAQNTLRSWIDREVLTLGMKEIRASPEVRAHALSLRRVYQIAITRELVKLDVAPKRAAYLAVGFTDVGHGGTRDSGGLQRLPGELFKDAFTWLVAPRDLDVSRIIRVLPTTTAIQLIDRHGPGAIILPLDPVIQKIHKALGLD